VKIIYIKHRRYLIIRTFYFKIMVAINNSSLVTNSGILISPQSLAQLNNANTSSPLNRNDSFTTSSVVANDYPQVTNEIPVNIFTPQNTQNTANTNTTTSVNSTYQNNAGGSISVATNSNTSGTSLKPVSMSEAQWAVKFEEKVMKQGYKAPADEMAKYQDIVARYKANPKVDSSILEVLSAQSSGLGAQVSAMRYGSSMGESFKAIKQSVSAGTGMSGAMSSLKTLGQTTLKATGLSAIVSGGFSLITNGIQVFQGKKTWSDVGGSVVADAANGAVSGITASLAAGGASLLAAAIGGPTLVGTLVVGLGAAGGAWLGDKLFKDTGAYDYVKDNVTNALSGKYQNAQQYVVPETATTTP